MAEKTTKKPVKAAVARERELLKARAANAKKKKPSVVHAVGAKHANGFIDFIRTQGVVGMAVGLAIGTAAGDTVKKLVEGFINPFVQIIVGSHQNLETATWTLVLSPSHKGDFKWGAFVSSAITLTATALVIYLIIHFARLDRLDKKKES